jgi:hypothetical protein
VDEGEVVLALVRGLGGLKTDAQIPDGAEILVGIDAARSFDTTAVTWAGSPRTAARSSARTSGRCAAERPAPHVRPGGELVNEELVEPFVDELAAATGPRDRVRPALLQRRGAHLANAGHLVVEVQPQSKAMGDAVVLFEKDALGGRLGHDGDRVLAGHIEAIDADERPGRQQEDRQALRGHPIDAGIA